MTTSRLRERLERLGPIQDIARVTGSPAVVQLRIERPADVQPIIATRALARRGLSLLLAKRAIEAALETGVHAAKLPSVEDRDALIAELRGAGIQAAFVSGEAVDVRALRDRLRLSREQFALRFGLSLDTVEKWESGDRKPDSAAACYLRTIAADPDYAMTCQSGEVRKSTPAGSKAKSRAKPEQAVE
jgi:putative transcriptional regulator